MNIAADSVSFNLPVISPDASSKPSKLHQAAQQFESLMISEMMKSVHEGSSSGWLGSDGDEGGDNQAMEMAESQFANALAMNGGLGLARMVEQSIGQQDDKVSSAAVKKN
jgi:Rod binding domain-containing protein